jgi:hypothetical protein
MFMSGGCLSVTSALPVTGTNAIQTEELVQYMLQLINEDRADYGQSPVTLGTNTAAQKHAEDMLANYYLSHWDTEGLKPYMRYTLAGGVNYEAENSAYHGWYDSTEDADRYVNIDHKEILRQLEYNMMYDDAASNWGHRDAILNVLNKKVNIGIAFDAHRIALVQQFEGDYIYFTQPPAIINESLYLSGSLYSADLYSIRIFYDPLKQPLTHQELMDKPRFYDLGEEMGYVLPPQYHLEKGDFVNAAKWEINADGTFNIEADINILLQHNQGIYTVCVIASSKEELHIFSNYSIFIQ